MSTRPTPEQIEAIAPDWLSFLRADDWGRTWQHPPVAEQLDDVEHFIHHTAGPEYRDKTAAEAMKLAELVSHNKGYASVGYDTMVHGDADDQFTICGAREGWRSAATKDRNEIGEATCAFGYYHPGHSLSAEPRERMVKALAWAVAWSIAHGWTAVDAVVYGHRDNPSHPSATACPGDYLYPHVGTIADLTREILASALTYPEPEPENPTMRRFLTPGSSTAQWITTDGVIAVRLTRAQAQALGTELPELETLTVDEARRFAFVNALEADVIGNTDDA